MSLDAKEVIGIGTDILKSDADSSFVLSSLAKLKTGVKPTEDFLRSTKIGVHVAKLKQHKDPQVAQQASQLVNSWRAAIKSKEKLKAVSQTNGAAPSSGTSTPAPAPVKKDAAAPAPAPPAKAKVPPEKRDATTDGVNTTGTGHSARDGCLKLMYNGLAFMSDSDQHPSSKILPIAQAIENAGFSHLPQVKGEPSPAYREKMRSLFQNLKNKSNPMLRQRLLIGEVSPDKFVRMTDEELKSPERAAEDKQLEKINMDNASLPKEEKSISTAFTCTKCHQMKVTYTQAQTRSADEPMTTFCTCTNCGHRWKFS